MTNGISNGGPAFPSKFTIESGSFDPVQGKVAQGNQVYVQMGVTMRDYFAAKAMQAIIEKTELLIQASTGDGSKLGAADELMDAHRRGVCKSAYQYADAMIIAREK